VIAAVILVAIAVILAASLSGFASGLLGVYSYSPQISISGFEVQEDGTGKIVFENTGAKGDSLYGLQVYPNSMMVLKTHHNNGNNGNNGNNNGNNEHDPQCQEHSENGNCLHDQDHGHSGDSNGHQNNNGNNGNNGNNNGNNNNDGGNGYIDTLDLNLPPFSKTEISWDETSLGEFSRGDVITVEVFLDSGNRLTYSGQVS